MRISSIALGALTCCGIAFGCGAALAQSAKDIVGTWTLASVTLEEGGKKSEPFGPAPKGMAVFDGARQSIVIVRPDMPKFATNNRNTGTAEENKAAVQGSLTFFGPYTFDEASKVMTVVVEGSNFPNWIGLNLKRNISVTGDTLTITNPTPTASGPGGVATIVWQRAR
ncbi:MAG: lipocalin-like domain-containing protein [Hyphomicrobiaceae bacterium]|nr:lipocalin-like domain-containing protein [Hyphomicrobiaceae bacterium]